MTRSKFLTAAAALSLAAGALLPHSAAAASSTLSDFLRGGQARAESAEMASAGQLDDNGRESDDSGAGRDSDGGSNHDSDGGSDHDSDGGSDHDSDGGSDGGSDHDSDGGSDSDD